MDILSHSLSGVALSTVLLPFSKFGTKGKTFMLLAGASGGFLPDFDAISLWTGFDLTIGRFAFCQGLFSFNGRLQIDS